MMIFLFPSMIISQTFTVFQRITDIQVRIIFNKIPKEMPIYGLYQHLFGFYHILLDIIRVDDNTCL